MSKKLIIGIALAAALGAGGYVAYDQGLIPAFSAAAKTEAELKTEIEALKGDAYGKKYEAVFRKLLPTDSFPEAEKAQFEAMFSQAFKGTTLNYDAIASKSGNGVAAVELTNVMVASAGNAEMGVPKSEAIYPKVLVSKSTTDAGSYSIQAEGKAEFYNDIGGQKMKLFSATLGKNSTDFKINSDGGLSHMKSSVADLAIIEGRGDTMLFKIGEMSSEYKSASTAEKTDLAYNVYLKNLEPGDMAKMFLGGIKPISFAIDFGYKGDDVAKAMAKTPSQAAKIPEVNGDLDLTKFEIKMGEAGLEANADLSFAKGLSQGTAKVAIVKYQELIDYFSKFAPIPPAEVEKMVSYLSEVGKSENGNFIFDIAFDDEGKAKINGRTLEEVKAIEMKYFPPLEVPAATPPAAVESAPIQ